jgi:hypothetical protein
MRLAPRNRSRASRHVIGVLGLVFGALLATSACAGIPSSGPVTKVADDGGFGESTVRYAPAHPAEGASPQEIVRGYLDAMLAYPASSRTATAFLTPAGAKRWNPAAAVRVYSSIGLSGPTLAAGEDGETTDKTHNPVEVETRLVEDARLDQQGHYARRARPAEMTYRLERVDREWRIANPQAGLLVSRKFFEDYFRPFDIYNFDRSGRRVVPDLIHLLVGDQLATGLVTSLARGPAIALTDGAVRTYVPPLSAMRPSVPVSDDGVADVEFSSDFSKLSESAQDHLAAQIVWTLRQVPGLNAVRLIGDTTTLSTTGSAVQDIGSWGGYGPSIARGHAYAIADDKVVQVDDATVRPLSGAWGKDARGVVAVDVSDDGVAGVLAGRNLVRVTNRAGTGARTFGGSRFITPCWDDNGNVWLLDRKDARTRVRLVTDERIRTLDIGGLAGLDASTFALSPDGSRYAVTALRAGRTSIQVGWVLRDAKDRILGLGAPREVYTTAASPRSVSWSSGTELTYLATSRSGRQVYTTAIDGSSTSGGISRGGALLPDVGPRTLASGTGETPNRYVTDARNRLWFLAPGESWRMLPTSGITGLTYGH